MPFVRSALSACALALSLVAGAWAQPVTEAPDAEAAFADRLAWGAQQAERHDAAWVGYLVRTWDAEKNRSWYGSYRDDRRQRVADVLGLAMPGEMRRADGFVASDVALFVRADRGQLDFETLTIRSLDGHADFDGLPIYWLGLAETSQSVRWLTARFGEARTADAREELVTAVGAHRSASHTLDFLTGVATATQRDRDVREAAVFWLSQQGTTAVLPLLDRLVRQDRDEDVQEKAIFAITQVEGADVSARLLALARDRSLRTEAREDAVFWLGQEGGPGVLDPLLTLARDDPDEAVRDKAVFAIGQIDGDAATEALVTLARSATRTDVQEDAVFWLGQRAAERTGATIQSIAFDAATTAVQEKAVFALAQLDPDDGVPRLIEIARTHPNTEVRERAIFWLSQSADRRAEDALVRLARGE